MKTLTYKGYLLIECLGKWVIYGQQAEFTFLSEAKARIDSLNPPNKPITN